MLHPRCFLSKDSKFPFHPVSMSPFHFQLHQCQSVLQQNVKLFYPLNSSSNPKEIHRMYFGFENFFLAEINIQVTTILWFSPPNPFYFASMPPQPELSQFISGLISPLSKTTSLTTKFNPPTENKNSTQHHYTREPNIFTRAFCLHGHWPWQKIFENRKIFSDTRMKNKNWMSQLQKALP